MYCDILKSYYQFSQVGQAIQKITSSHRCKAFQRCRTSSNLCNDPRANKAKVRWIRMGGFLEAQEAKKRGKYSLSQHGFRYAEDMGVTHFNALGAFSQLALQAPAHIPFLCGPLFLEDSF